MLSWSYINDSRQDGGEDDVEDEGPRETSEAREARHNSAYKEALALHGEGSPHSEAWAKAKQLYDTVIADKPAAKKTAGFDTPVRFLCLKNMADMLEREGDVAKALELQVAAAEEDQTDLAVWLKMARLARAAGLLNLARLALERLLETRADHVLALRMLRDVLSEIGDVAACREVTARLLNVDPYGSSRQCASSVRPPASAGLPLAEPAPSHCHPRLERTLSTPSWERVGRLLVDIRSSIGGEKAAGGRGSPGPTASTSAGESAGVSSAGASPSTVENNNDGGKWTSSPAPTLSTPVRIVLRRQPDETVAAASALARSDSSGGVGGSGGSGGGSGGGGGSSTGGGDGVGHSGSLGGTSGNNSRDNSGEPWAADIVQDHSEEVAAAAAAAVVVKATAQGKRDEQQQQQGLLRGIRRRLSVEKAMEWYSDGSSSDSGGEDNDEETGKGSGDKGGGRGGGGNDEGALGPWGGGRRTSARRQKQDEIREADVAAARENDMKFRVANLFIAADGAGTGNNPGAAVEDSEAPVWWPQLVENARGGGGGGDGGVAGAEEDIARDDEEGTALASKMLPRWKQRHDVDCRRCGEGGIVLCCDFCHLVYHPRCLEVTPSLTSLFACLDCKEEAATLEWERKGRDAAGGAVAGGLQELLTAADGGGGNAGVVDLMLRWLQGIAAAPAEDLCPEASFYSDSGGGDKCPDGKPVEPGEATASAATLGMSQLATVALAIEPIVRGYLPAYLSWPVLTAHASFPAVDGATPAAGSGVALSGGPELGLACELALAEMRMDKALSLMQQQHTTRRGVNPAATSASGPSGPSVPGAAPAAATASAAAGATAVAGAGVAVPGPVAAVSSDGGKATEVPPGGSSAGVPERVEACSRLSPDRRRVEAMRHLAVADDAMLQLEPWCLSIGDGGDGGVGVPEGGSAAQRASNASAWALAVRWWWLKGIRERHAGRREEALACFRRCKRVLGSKERKLGELDSLKEADDRDEDEDKEGSEEAVVLLPYCVVHPRIDTNVVRGVMTDVELSGTSEAARDVFTRAIRLLSECAVGTEKGAGGNTVVAAVAAAAEAKAGTAATSADAAQATSQARVLPGGDGVRSGDALRVEEQAQSEVNKTCGSGSKGPSEGGANTTADAPTAPLEEVAAESRPRPPRPVSSNGAPDGERGVVTASTASGAAAGEERPSPSITPDGTVISTSVGGGATPSPLSSPKDEAVAALMNVMQGLEMRFVARAPSSSLGAPKSVTDTFSSAAATPAGGQGREIEGVDAETDTAGGVGAAKSGGSKQEASRRGGGWSVLIRPARAEELLADLLEKEKASFAQTNRDGAKALERWSAAGKGNGNGNVASNEPPFFLAPAMAASATLVPVAGVPAAAPAAVVSAGGATLLEIAGATPSTGSSSTPGVTSARVGAGSEPSPGQRWHFPLALSSTGLGEHTSVFSMMLRGESLLGRHETAVLLAVRCSEHFLDASEVLTSPRGPLSVGGGARSPGKGARKGAFGNGNEGLGAVHLLLTSRQEGGDRRVVDVTVSSACAEFLAHALAVVVWAVPHATRAELFGGGDGGGGRKSEGVREVVAVRAAARKASVLRCLARLMRRSMDSDNTRVLNLCICAWQAIVAVAPPVPSPTPAFTLALPPAVRVPPPPLPLASAGSKTNDATPPADAGTEAPTPLQDAMEVETIGRDGRDGPGAPSSEAEGLVPPVAGDGGVDGRNASGAMRHDCANSVVDAFADPLKALVRCLCGVVIGRWRQASSTGRAPKKAWVLHAMEGVLALVRALQYHRNRSSSTITIKTTTTTGRMKTGGTGASVLAAAPIGADAIASRSFASAATDIAGAVGVAGGTGVVSDAADTSNPAGAADDAPYLSFFFASAAELKEVIDALMGLSRLPDAPITSAAASVSSMTKGGGSAGGGGGGIGVKLACSLAVLTVGLIDAAAPLDARRRVSLVEALHDHLKGKLGAASVNLGAVLQGQGGYGGICADGEGRFLKAALLYLSSQEVVAAIKKDEIELRLAGELSSSSSSDSDDDSSEASSNDGTDDEAIDVVGGGGDGKEKGGHSAPSETRDEVADVSQGEPGRDAGNSGVIAGGSGGGGGSGADGGVGGGVGGGGGGGGGVEGSSGGDVACSGGNKGRPKRKRTERLGERVLRAVSQCQACLYDIAMITCADHRCLTPPRPPSTALEAHALYVCWESRLPDLRRSDTLRLLESVIAHKTFSSPPPTRFSTTVENHLFLEWSVEAAAAGTELGQENQLRTVGGSASSSGGGGGGGGCGGGGGGNSGGGGGRSQPRALSPLPEADLVALEDALGLHEEDPPSTTGSHTGENEEGKEEPAFSCSAPTGGGGEQGSTVGEPGVGASGTLSLVGCDTEVRGTAGIDKHAPLSAGAVNTREEEEKEEDGSGRKTGLDGSPERHALARLGSGKRRALDPETDPFLPVYLGLYWNLAEAKGVPSGFKSRTTKSMDEVSDTEALLMQGIQWRVLDLRFCPDRLSSWKGLAQCACRLAAIYLDAFPPSCHRLNVPLTVTSGAETISEEDAAADAAADATAQADGAAAAGVDAAAGGGGEGVGGEVVGSCASTNSAQDAGHGVTAMDTDEAARVSNAGGSPRADGAEGWESRPLARAPPGSLRTNNDTDDIDGNSNGNTNVSGASHQSSPPEKTLPAHETGTAGTEREVHDRRATEPAPPSLGRAAGEAGAPLAANEVSAPAEGAKCDTCPGAPTAPATNAEPLAEVPSEGGGLDHDLGVLGKRRRISPAKIDTLEKGREVRGRRKRLSGRDGEKSRSVFGIRGVPGPDLGPFFRGTALDAKAARKGDSGSGAGGGGSGGSRVAAIAAGLRRMAVGEARTAAEASAIEAMATRVSEGSATQEEWVACLGHASLAAAAGLAERSFAAWKALAEHALARVRATLVPGGGGREAGGEGDGGISQCEAAAKDLAMCCEEEAFVKFMLARDVWPGLEDDDATTTAAAATAATNPTGAGLPPTPAGLEVGGGRRLMESSLELLERARHLRETGGSPLTASPRPSSSFRRRRAGSPSAKGLSDSPGGSSSPDVSGGGQGEDKEEGQEKAKKKRKVGSAGATGRDGGGGAGGTGGGGGGDAVEDEDEDDEDVFRWQVPFVMGTLCSQLGREPRVVLGNLWQALQLAKADHVPLEDELEALCCLHAARAELVLSGDVEGFLERASMLEAFSFREEEEDGDTENEVVTDVPPPTSSSLSGGDGDGRCPLDGPGQAGVERGGPRRRLAALENCLDAFESCLVKQKGQHTAIFATANVLHRGAGIAEDARKVSIAQGVLFQGRKRSFGSQAALLALKPLFEKRQQLLQAMSVSDGVVGPGLALLSSRRRKLQSLRRKYLGLYVDLLEATRSTITLQGLLRRTRATRETRDEMLWMQDRVLRALLTILRSEFHAPTSATPTPVATPSTSLPPDLATNPSPPLPPATNATLSSGASSGATAGDTLGASRGGGMTTAMPNNNNPGEGRPEGVGNSSAAPTPRGGGGGAGQPVAPVVVAPLAEDGVAAAAISGQPRPQQEQQQQQQQQQQEEDVHPLRAEAAAMMPLIETDEASRGDSESGAESGGDAEKRSLERAWDLYLQVVDLESAARGGNGGNGGGGVRSRRVPSVVTLLSDAEDVLVKSWQAFGAANAAVLELVELQNPSSSLAGGSAVAGGEGGGVLLRRVRACCHALWPDKQGKGKVSKSKLKLKRPAPGPPQGSSANRTAPRPKVPRPAAPAAEKVQPPAASAVATAPAGGAVEPAAQIVSTTPVMPGVAGSDASPTSSTAAVAMEVSSASQSADGSAGEAAKTAKPAALAVAAHVAAVVATAASSSAATTTATTAATASAAAKTVAVAGEDLMAATVPPAPSPRLGAGTAASGGGGGVDPGLSVTAAAPAPKPAPQAPGTKQAPVREAQGVTRGWLVAKGGGATSSAAGAAVTGGSNRGPASVPEEDGSASSDECVIVD